MRELNPEVYKESKDVVDNIVNSAKHHVLNIAADCAINCGITGLPDGACYPKSFKLEDNQTLEFYAEKLKQSEDLKHINNLGDHSLWSESEGGKEELKEKIKAAVKMAAGRAKTVGSLSSELELLIDRLNYQPKSWKRELHRFAARALEIRVETSRKKRNRRYGIMYPGTVKEEVLHIGVAIDTSGSVSDEALNQFMAEIGNIAKYAQVTVVEADSEVKNSYEFNPKKTYKIKGRGGTAYQPAFDWFNDNTEVDGVIYFGDMDCFDSEEIKKPKYPVLWAIVGEQSPPVTWGGKTSIIVKVK
jgi:predicted metal-dependent peptidase